jgi:aryl-alcohol dehydrogenase-like predicted oxidoreductase
MDQGHLADKTVNRVGFGAMQLAGKGVFGPPRDPDEARAVLRRAVELGVDHIDTAQFYGPDVVNDLIREALHPYPDGLKLATKIGARRDEDGAWLPAFTPAELRDQVEQNLRSLRVERLDLVNLRAMSGSREDPDRVEGFDFGPFEEGLAALTELREEGKLDLIGISTVPPAALERALELTEVAAVQNSFSIVDQADRATLDLCREHGVAYVPYFPLGSAFTGGPAALAEDEAIAAVAAEHDATPSQVALAWLLSLDENVLLIPGTGSVAHLEENVAAGELVLDADDLSTLEAVKHLGDPMARMQH